MSDCDVCGGTGYYQIINMKGAEVYSVRCPDCYGSGEAYEESAEDDPSLPPPSTAARLKTMDDLRAYVQREAARINRKA